ncbi:beta-glucosidase family protein [Aquitalea denitrificans]|uniref:beta-glucosidase family protein n=1 Tax=Aquitalea denitrificans TaxID=519081 RepID=UPI001356B9E7|nr:glycoside hydrolase family 3 C-terminal domain-containing protein [Aquitalea denitrificans]
MTANHQELIARMRPQDKVKLLSGQGLWRTASLPEFGIRDFVMTDGTYGVRYSSAQIDQQESWNISDFLSVVQQDAGQQATDSDKGGSEVLFGHSRPATCFPNGSSLACSWDVALVEQMGRALAIECQSMGVGLLLGPGINIRRTPLAGRGYEYYSEDPLLSGDLAAALINGLQQQGVGASLKHFACNNSEYMRTEMDSIVDERALHEIYLYGFQRAIAKAQPWTVMSSYNRLNGEQTSQHHWLLTRVLREEWGYQGLVMSDWYGIKDRPASLLAGNELAMPENALDNAELLAAIEQGRIPAAVLDQACLHMLQLIDKVQAGCQPGTVADFASHHPLARRIAAESLVLLKNDQDLLPLNGQQLRRLAVIGKPAQQPVIQGSGCATTQPWQQDCPLDEIRSQAGSGVQIDYAVGAPDDQHDDAAALQQACTIAAAAEVAVVFVSTPIGMDGENGDRQHLGLLPSHDRLISRLAAVQPKLVVVLCNGDAVLMPWLPQVPAVLECFFAGQGMGHAVAATLFGVNNPSGKLTTTLPNSLEETPAYLHYPGENGRHHYGEGLFVGYRYYDKRQLQPLFPFGFGLSYTRFDYRELQLSSQDMTEHDTLTVSIEIHNSGERDGKEIVQLYIAPPPSPLARPPQALRGFDKLDIPAGSSRHAHFTLQREDFAYYDPAHGSWVVDSGPHEIRIAASSRDIRLQATVAVTAQPPYPRLKADSSLVQLTRHPPMLQAVAELVASKCALSVDDARAKLIQMAPNMFGGLFITLTAMLELDISRAELQLILDRFNSMPSCNQARDVAVFSSQRQDPVT